MDFLSHLEVDILSNLGQFLEFGVDPRLCVGLRELSCAPSRKLVDIEPSGVLFGAIFVSRVLCGDSETSVRARCLCHETFEWDCFSTPHTVCGHRKCTNTVPETRIEPSCAEIGRELTPVDQKLSTSMVQSFSEVLEKI